jgi:hypothetical protein
VRGAALAASSNTAACPAGRPNATIYNVAVTADLATTAAGSFVNADNTLSISASVADGASDGAGGFPHTSTSSQTATVTRRLWQTGAISAGQLAMGPVLIVATPSGIINGLARADGSAAWPAAASAYPLFSGPAVGGTASSPTVYYGLNNNAPSNGPSVFSLSAASGLSGSSCNAQAFVTRPAICSAAPLVRWRLSQFLALATDGSAAILEDDESDAATATGADCGAEGYGGIRMVGATCSIWIPALTVQSSTSSIGFLPSASGLAIGRNGRAFYVDRSHPQEIAVSGGAITSGSGVTCTKTSIITDSNGNDAPVCNGEHLVFSSGFGKDWSASFTTPLDAIGLLFGNASGSTQPYALASGSTAALTAAASRIPWAIDASNPPVIYLSTAAMLYAQRLSVAGIGASVWALPSVPGTAITDVVMDNAGVLYVSSNGQVSAMVTDSPGLGTGSNGWPIAGHDACRSYNLEYQCPW